MTTTSPMFDAERAKIIGRPQKGKAMKVVLFGATGMVGARALLECLADPRVESVLALTRSSTGRRHPKLRELVHKDFFNYDHLAGEFAACIACCTPLASRPSA